MVGHRGFSPHRGFSTAFEIVRVLRLRLAFVRVGVPGWNNFCCSWVSSLSPKPHCRLGVSHDWSVTAVDGEAVTAIGLVEQHD